MLCYVMIWDVIWCHVTLYHKVQVRSMLHSFTSHFMYSVFCISHSLFSVFCVLYFVFYRTRDKERYRLRKQTRKNDVESFRWKIINTFICLFINIFTCIFVYLSFIHVFFVFFCVNVFFLHWFHFPNSSSAIIESFVWCILYSYPIDLTDWKTPSLSLQCFLLHLHPYTLTPTPSLLPSLLPVWCLTCDVGIVQVRRSPLQPLQERRIMLNYHITLALFFVYQRY